MTDGCSYLTHPGDYYNQPEYCDEDAAEDGMGYCTKHAYTLDDYLTEMGDMQRALQKEWDL